MTQGHREAQARYKRTDKGRATTSRYEQRRYWRDPVGRAARIEAIRRAARIARMETQLEELLDAS